MYRYMFLMYRYIPCIQPWPSSRSIDTSQYLKTRFVMYRYFLIMYRYIEEDWGTRKDQSTFEEVLIHGIPCIDTSTSEQPMYRYTFNVYRYMMDQGSNSGGQSRIHKVPIHGIHVPIHHLRRNSCIGTSRPSTDTSRSQL